VASTKLREALVKAGLTLEACGKGQLKVEEWRMKYETTPSLETGTWNSWLVILDFGFWILD
jgi:hypothetical protein